MSECKSSGIYNSREELVAACLHLSNTSKLSHRLIGERVGVSSATVTRILSGDAPEYRAAYEAVRELPSSRLNKFWRIPAKIEGISNEELR